MKNSKKVFAAFCFFIFAVFLHSQNYSSIVQDKSEHSAVPEQKTPEQVLESKTSVIIRANVPKADVFVNGVYQGETDLEISNLRQGVYIVEVKKPGYTSERFSVTAKGNYALNYYIRLKKLSGTISILDVPEGASVFIDDNQTELVHTEAEPGFHKVFVKKFGYENFYSDIEVFDGEITKVEVFMNPVDFKLSDFSVEKTSFNPEYKGHAGKCQIQFYVSADGDAKVQIESEDGKVVYEYEWKHFSTWFNAFSWDGKDSAGNMLEDGIYTVKLVSSKLSEPLYREIKIDRTIRFPLMSIGKNGASIGSLPVVFAENQEFLMPYLNAAPVLSSDSGFYCADISFGLLANAYGHFELSVGGSVFAGRENLSVVPAMNINLKAYSSLEISDSFDFCYGAIVRYGAASNYLYEPLGTDRGFGLGFGGLCGIESDLIYAGFSSQFAFGTNNGDLRDSQNVWKNGITFSFKPFQNLCLNTWFGLHSAFGDVYEWFRCTDFGLEACFMPVYSVIQFNAQTEVSLIFNSGNFERAYTSIRFGLSYLF